MGATNKVWDVSSTYFMLQSMRRSEFGCENPIQGTESVRTTPGSWLCFVLGPAAALHTAAVTLASAT